MVNIRTVKNALKLHENVMQNYFSIVYQLIKIGIYSSAAILKVVTRDCKTNRRCEIKNSDRACPVAAVACFDRHVTKSRSLNFSLCLTDLIAQRLGVL